MTEIALAYSSMDKARAEAIAKVLGALGYTVSPQPVTAATVDRAAALVVFWSAGSVNSIPINQLASQASCDHKLVSVRASQTDPPAAYALVALHDLSRWTGSLDAPELRTFLQHILRMAPPPGQAQQQAGAAPQRAPMSVAAGANAAAASGPSTFAFAGPLGAATRPGESPRAFAPPPVANPQTSGPVSPTPARAIGLRGDGPPPPQAAPAPVAPVPVPPQAAPAPAPRRAERETRPQERPAVRRAAERRRAKGGGAARVAMGAIAVSVIAGAAVAAFNYEPNQQTAAKSGPDGEAKSLTAAISVAPNALTPEAAVASDAAPADGGIQVAAVEPPPVATPDQAATLQSNRGWTATLPTGPAVGSRTVQAAPVTATPVSAGAPAPQRRVGLRAGATKLTPIDAGPSGPAPTDLVAVDGANLGGDPVNTLAPRPRTAEEERAWIRKNSEYGPTQ